MHFRTSWTRSISACCIRQVPSGASGGRGVNFLIDFFTSKFQETSVAKSRINGNAFIGSIVTGSFSGNSSNRVIHINFGRPLISAEQDPHFPALQFQRHARSVAWVAWILCTASSTTIPSETSVEYSTNFPPFASPRQILKTVVLIFASPHACSHHPRTTLFAFFAIFRGYSFALIRYL